MYSDKKLTRKTANLLLLLNLITKKWITIAILVSFCFLVGFASSIFNLWLWGVYDPIILFRDFFMFLTIAGLGIVGVLMFKKKSPIFTVVISVQMNIVFVGFFSASYLFGELLAVFTKNNNFVEVFFILGAIISYIIAFIIFFSFTTVGRPWYLFLALIQPSVGIILHSFFTYQVNIDFFFRAIIFFCTCALIFALPYSTGMISVSKIYRHKTGIGGYNFIRAFVLSLLTDKNDDMIEDFFDQVGVLKDIDIRYLAIRGSKNKNLKGLMVLPDVHFGPFKTSGSSDLPEMIYMALSDIKGTTVFHTTNTHEYNTTKQLYKKRLLDQIKDDVDKIKNDNKLKWSSKYNGFSREMVYSAKVLGITLDEAPILFVSRHPFESDDIEPAVGTSIIKLARKSGFEDAFIIDCHNAIIGDEILVTKDSKAGKDIIEVCKKFFETDKASKDQSDEDLKILYGVARDPLKEYSEKDGIGNGGLTVHLFHDTRVNEKIALIHFDGNNALLEVRPMIFNFLQNKGIDKGEITTSDSHTVARIFTARGYFAIGEKIKIDYILQKLDKLIDEADKDLEPVEFHFNSTVVKDIKIWGDQSYFEVIMDTLQQCISVSKVLLTLGLMVPAFFSLLLLLFYYNIDITDLIP